MYDSVRYFVLTGNVYEGRESIQERHGVVEAVQADQLPERKRNRSTGEQKPQSEQVHAGETTDVRPKTVRRTIEIYRNSSKTDVNGASILRLWDGSDLGYESASEADIVFVGHLHFWCKGDERLINECFGASKRMRSKIERVS